MAAPSADRPTRLSVPFESLFGLTGASAPPSDGPETLIVGSGYGAAFAALALVERGAKNIWVLERGNEFVPGEFPSSFGGVPGQVSITTGGGTVGYAQGLWDVRVGTGMTAILGRGLGGGSLINANVAFDLDPEELASWPRPEGQAASEWNERFIESKRRAATLLGVTTHGAGRSLSKFRALEDLADRLGEDCSAELAPLTISFKNGKNEVGVHQSACVDCGNCVSGCNAGAKGSLDMNVWPLLVSHGVRIFTGATVRKISRADGFAWHVEVRATRSDELEMTLTAGRVILSAGAIGSTEILRRSEDLELSRAQLGCGFSGNGDLLGFGQGTQTPVRGGASRPSTFVPPADPDAAISDQVGPTIVGFVRVPSKDPANQKEPPRPQFLLQDGAVPFPARRIAEEVVVTRNVLRYLAEGSLPSWLNGGGFDPAAGTMKASEHHPMHLVMGRGSGTGRLAFENDVLVPQWPADDCSPKVDFARGVRAALRGAGRSVDSGEAPVFDEEPEGPIRELRGRGECAVTVHPLGGCCMATRAESGVVSPEGAVFAGSTGTKVHQGLYVLDGSIFPSDIGVNPFLTIAALAHQLARQIPLDVEREEKVTSVAPRWEHRAPPRQVSPVSHPEDESVGGAFRERFFLRLSETERGKLAEILPLDVEGQKVMLSSSARDHRSEPVTLVLDACIEVDDVFDWLRDPSRELTATYELSASTVGVGDTVPSTGLVPLFRARGAVNLGGLDRVAGLDRFMRGTGVFFRFLFLRGGELWREMVESVRSSFARGHAAEGRLSLFEKFRRAVARIFVLARVQTDFRLMTYRFEAGGLSFSGRKELAYRGSEPDPLRTLSRLPFTLRQAGGGTFSGELEVDLIRLTGQPAALQLSRTPSSPISALALGALSLFFGRGVLSSMFWSFKRPVYERFGSKFDENTPRLEPLPSSLSFDEARGAEGRARRDFETFGRFPGVDSTDRFSARRARLVRYRHPHGVERKTALLIHGLAHGSRVFTTETIPEPLALTLLSRGYDVWLLDHSLSTTLEREPDAKVNMDDLAREDIPWAIETISQVSRAEADSTWPGLHVFAHCIGAGAFAMSVLAGRLEGQPIRSVVLHAVTPWLIASRDNRWRANVLSLYKDSLTMGYFDPIPHRDPSTPESLYDALAGSFSWGTQRAFHEEHDRGDYFSRTVCNRMTLFYGEEWVHKNLAPETHRDIATLVGPGSLEIMRQAHSCVVRGRLTDRDGRAPYVLRENFLRYWDFPTRFLHGAENCVFRAEGSKRSAKELFEIFRDHPQRHVSVQIIDGYGHMDLVFGKDASRDVYPKIYEFFERPRSDVENSRFRPEPCSSLGNASTPEVGPIISHPRKVDGQVRLRVWATTNPLAVERPERIEIPGLKLQARSKQARRDRKPRRDFWIGEASVDQVGSGTSRAGFWPTPGAPLAERSPPPLGIFDQPWFRRLEKGVDEQAVSFLVGACLHPGIGAERQRSDSVFGEMKRHLADGRDLRGVDHLQLLGDQIYADATGELFDPKSPHERFRLRYVEAFGGPTAHIGQNAHFIMSHLPTYFSVDDHEIRNDWSRNSRPGAKLRDLEREEEALDAAYDFLVHEPQDQEKRRFWYSFVSAGFSFFVFDTRSERDRHIDRARVDALIGRQQQDGFRGWLEERRAESGPVFFSTGSSLVPITHACAETIQLARHDDGLLGFTGFLEWLTEQLQDFRGRPIVWLSGDVHASSVCDVELRLAEGEPVRVIAVAASGLHAPLPFINTPAASFPHDPHGPPVRIALGRLAIASKQRLLVEDCVSNFVRVDWIDGHLHVRGVPGSAANGARGYAWQF